jgi:hypothetical protein
LADWKAMEHEEAIQKIMDDLKVDRHEAEFILALQTGEIEGDAEIKPA